MFEWLSCSSVWLGLTRFLRVHLVTDAGGSVTGAVVRSHLDVVTRVGFHVVQSRVVLLTGNQHALGRRLVLHRLSPEPHLTDVEMFEERKTDMFHTIYGGFKEGLILTWYPSTVCEFTGIQHTMASVADSGLTSTIVGASEGAEHRNETESDSSYLFQE